MNKAITICLVIVGLINFVPVIGVLSAQKIESAYAVILNSNDLAILMRHRALLFGILGAFILYSAFHPAYQPAAMLMGAVSMLGFALLVWTSGQFNASIAKVLYIDIAGIIILFLAVILYYYSKK